MPSKRGHPETIADISGKLIFAPKLVALIQFPGDGGSRQQRESLPALILLSHMPLRRALLPMMGKPDHTGCTWLAGIVPH